MALDMPQIDDIRRLWSEGRDVSEISRMTGHDRKTVRKRLQYNCLLKNGAYQTLV